MQKLVTFSGLGLIIIIAFGTLYGAVQQAQRSDANNPQIQIAEDAAAALNHGEAPGRLTQSVSVNLKSSLAPFVVIYDRSGRPVTGTGYLDGHLPTPPRGVLTATESRAYHAVTWQPQAGVRIAAVSVAANQYYVLSGRSMTEVEKNESRTERIAAAGAVASLAVLLAVFWLTGKRRRTA